MAAKAMRWAASAAVLALLLALTLQPASVEARRKPVSKLRQQCNAEQTLSNCGTSGGTNGLCYYCNPTTPGGVTANINFDLQTCKQVAATYLKKAISCAKLSSYALEGPAFCDTFGTACTTSSDYELGATFTAGNCGITGETCDASCDMCNPSNSCFNLDQCKALISFVVNYAVVYNEEGCVCGQTAVVVT